MHPSVSNGFVKITNKHEGTVPWLYLDQHKDSAGNPAPLISTGIGNMVEANGQPTAILFEQPWKNASGGVASRAEIQAAFDAVKAAKSRIATDLRGLGGGAPQYAALTTIRLGPPNAQVGILTPEIYSFVESVLLNFESTIKSSIPGYESLPADAQLALLEHAWAGGADLKGWPKLCAALNASPPNLVEAQVQDHMQGITTARAAMMAQLWKNAQDVQASGGDVTVLHYPVPGDSPSIAKPGGGGSGGGGGIPGSAADLLSKATPPMGMGMKLGLVFGAGLAAFGAGWILLAPPVLTRRAVRT